MENIGEYAALVAQSTAINENEFEEKAQEEQAEVEKQQSKNSAIEGVIAPFGVEAIKGAGGKFFKKAVGAKIKKKIQDVKDLAKRFKEDPQGVTEELYQKYQQSAVDRTPEDGGGIKDFIQRTLNGGTSKKPPPEDEEPAGRGTPDNSPENINDARNTNPEDLVPDTTAPPKAPEAAPAVEEPLSTPSAPLTNAIATENNTAGLSGEFDDLVEGIAKGRNMLDGVIQGAFRKATQIRQAVVPSTVDEATLTAARNPSNIINQGTTEARAGLQSRLKPPETGDGDPSIGNILKTGEANYNNETNVANTIEARLAPKPKAPATGAESEISELEGGPLGGEKSILKDSETLGETAAKSAASTAAGGVEKKTFEQGVKDALEANAADLENPAGDIAELALGVVALFGSLFGTKVHHQNVTAQVQQINPTIGFGIKQQ